MAGKKQDKAAAENASADEDKQDDGSGDGADESSALAGSVGLGLIGSVIVGFDPLRDAFQGNGSFENAVMRFLACVAVSVVGASMLGRLLDASAPTQRELEQEQAALRAKLEHESDKSAGANNAILESADRQEDESNV